MSEGLEQALRHATRAAQTNWLALEKARRLLAAVAEVVSYAEIRKDPEEASLLAEVRQALDGERNG